ncbi:hypothetical protein F750_5760 [Streptomyces sp. PAMC 26508]|nr:hypothetical protein F750_5760 [Streptomyces sp. PAMC 26508]
MAGGTSGHTCSRSVGEGEALRTRWGGPRASEPAQAIQPPRT